MVPKNEQIVALLLSCGLAGRTSASNIEYTITDIGVFSNAPSNVGGVYALGMNSLGQVVGDATTTISTSNGTVPAQHAFFYPGSGPLIDLGTLGGPASSSGAADINNSGMIVGSSEASSPGYPECAFVWTRSGGMTSLGTFGGQASYGYGVNSSGLVVGFWQTSSGSGNGFTWTAAHGMVDLPAFEPLAVNDQGILGGAAFATAQAALYNPATGVITNIGTLGGPLSQVNALSDTGFAVGLADVSASTSHAFLYNSNTRQMLDLGNPVSESWYSDASGVNDFGDVVGGYSTESDGGGGTAFIYTPAGGLQDLNDFIDPASGYFLEGATSINNAGEIVCLGVNQLGQDHAVLLTPTPEPSSLVITCAAAAGLALIMAIRSVASRRRFDTSRML